MVIIGKNHWDVFYIVKIIYSIIYVIYSYWLQTKLDNLYNLYRQNFWNTLKCVNSYNMSYILEPICNTIFNIIRYLSAIFQLLNILHTDK